MNDYRIILADPPWAYQVHSEKGKGRSAEHHYPTMPTEQIAALPVPLLGHPEGSVLLLWATWPNLPDAMKVIDAWGYAYKTAAFVWVKRSKRDAAWHTGMGYWSRANTEMMLLATRGDGYPRRINKGVKQVIFSEGPEEPEAEWGEGEPIIAPVQEHSRKPDEQYERIDALLGRLPRVELFARRPWPGWAGWGHGVTGGLDLAQFAARPPGVDWQQHRAVLQQVELLAS